MDIAAIGKVIEKIALHYPLGPIVILATLYCIYDGYKSSNGAEITFAGLALVWSLVTVFTFVMN
jgi:hypothetical protein